DRHAAKQLVSYAQIVSQRIWACYVRVDFRKRGRAEILRQLCQIDLAVRRSRVRRWYIHAAQFAVCNVWVWVTRGRSPGDGELDELHVCRIIERCNSCSSSRLEPVKAEADGRLCVTEQVIDDRHPRRECSPDRHMNIPKRGNIGKASMLCRLPWDLPTDVLPSQPVRDRHPHKIPRVLSLNSRFPVT